ncbi:twin-arginine translocation signal domain-containing protein [bacterium]|nr:twin-arginine translocation signal domain-containing protein [bacterium]
MINLTPEEREVGRDNYYSAVTAHDKVSRRDFLVRSIAAGGITAAGVGAMYFGYQRPNRPVRVCVIGTGDEGSVLMGAINPDYVQVTAICDIRPSSQHRAFHGDWSTDNTIKVRPGLMNVYNWKSEDEARNLHPKSIVSVRYQLNRKYCHFRRTPRRCTISSCHQGRLTFA